MVAEIRGGEPMVMVVLRWACARLRICVRLRICIVENLYGGVGEVYGESDLYME
jgi:hypothetical protein